MNIWSSGVFWGVMLLLIGLMIIFRAVFGWNLPIFKVLFGLLFIYIGFRILLGGFGWFSKEPNVIVMDKQHIEYMTGKKDYSIIFGSGVVDLRNIPADENIRKVEINVIFGDGKVYLPEDRNTFIEMNAVFGSVEAPERSARGFGSSKYERTSQTEFKEGDLRVEINGIFGSVRVQN